VDSKLEAEEKRMTLQISNYNNRVFTRDQLLVTGFGWKKLILCIIGRHARWREKIKSFQRQQELLNRK
jgi:hypothetical protein